MQASSNGIRDLPFKQGNVGSSPTVCTLIDTNSNQYTPMAGKNSVKVSKRFDSVNVSSI